MAYCKYCGRNTRGNNQFICGNCREEKREERRKKERIELKKKFTKRIKKYLIYLKNENAPKKYSEKLIKILKPLYKK